MYSQLKESVYNMTNKIMTQEKILEELDSMYERAENLEKTENNHPEAKYAFMCGSLLAQIEILSDSLRLKS